VHECSWSTVFAWTRNSVRSVDRRLVKRCTTNGTMMELNRVLQCRRKEIENRGGERNTYCCNDELDA
jgi:hypothetical protein